MKKAFTLIELMVVVGILGILIAVLISTFSGSSDSARTTKCQANMHNLAMAVQAVGMSSGYYPYAGTFQQYTGSNKEKKWTQGWIGANTSTYPSTYSSSEDDIEETLEQGSIWSAINHARESYVCPEHQNYANRHNLKGPMWSYAMNAYFGWKGNGGVRGRSYHGRHYRSFDRADRFLLFAEIPLTGEGDDADPVLQYDGCEGGGDEAISFNHKEGNRSIANVCFADGHVEKFHAPKKGVTEKELTKWLCHPSDSEGEFDVRFDGSQYTKARETL